MKKGDLIQVKKNFNGTKSFRKAIVVRGTYHKRVWGSSGHPEDTEIETMVDIFWIDKGIKMTIPLAVLRRRTEVLSESR